MLGFFPVGMGQLKSDFDKETYVLDKIPFEERRVIDELVEFWQTRYEPRDLVTHIDRLSGTWGSGRGADFIRQVYKNLCIGRRYRYASASELKQFLEAVYSRQAQAQMEAEKPEEYKRMARADFDALGKEMAKATTRAELVELGRKRADLAPHTGISFVYTNHCWNCKGHISSEIHAQCPVCKLYICGSCGSCLCGFLN